MNSLNPKIDPLGTAVQDYLQTSQNAEIRVSSNIAADDRIPVSHFFRTEDTMPELELQALEQCQGKTLDIGAAAGCHSLALQNRGTEVAALEYSILCCNVMQKRGVKNVICSDFYRYDGTGFDTLLLLMNGIGIAGSLRGLDKFLKRAFSMLGNGGSLIFDSSDIEYLYIEEDGSKLINLNSNYYGELTYAMHYKSITGKAFPWLFIDFKTLIPIAKQNGFEPILFARGDHYDYLGILRKT